MASELRVNTLKDASGNNSIGTSFVAGGSAKAWCKFGNDAQPDDSFNISSGTDVGTGQWRFAKTNAMSSTQHVIGVTSGFQIDTFNTGFNSAAIESTTNHTQSKYHEAGSAFQDFNSSGTAGYGMHSVHGDLA